MGGATMGAGTAEKYSEVGARRDMTITAQAAASGPVGDGGGMAKVGGSAQPGSTALAVVSSNDITVGSHGCGRPGLAPKRCL
jgi:hypothetical protein